MPLFRVSGIPVGVDWGALIMLGVVVLVLSGDYRDILGPEKQMEAFGWAVVAALAFFGSIILHEFGHAVVARRNGIGILGIDLWLLGGLAKMDREPGTPGVEFRVAAAGPAVTALIAVVCIGAAYAIDPDQAAHQLRLRTNPGDDAWMVALTSLGTVNLFLLVFNLIPAYPLDGGRIARSIAWRVTGNREKSTMVAAQIGRVFGYILIAFGVFRLSSSPFGGALFIYMGWTLTQAARAATMQTDILGEAAGLTVADVMDRQPVVMPGDASVQRALDEFFWRYRWPWFPVVDSTGHFLGLIEQHAVERVDEDDRGARHASELIAPQSGNKRAVNQSTPLTAVLANPELRDFGALMAVDEQGVLSGVVTVEQVQRALSDAIRRATASPPNNAPPSDL
jgi:Zn-dependent protease